MTPPEARSQTLRMRPAAWPCKSPIWRASGEWSSRKAMSGKLPFAFDRLIVVQPSHRLRPPGLHSGPMSYGDSLAALTLRRAASEPQVGEGRIMRIELSPDGGFDVAEPDPRRWIDLGYT